MRQDRQDVCKLPMVDGASLVTIFSGIQVEFAMQSGDERILQAVLRAGAK
jgi:hypothetical protein